MYVGFSPELFVFCCVLSFEGCYFPGPLWLAICFWRMASLLLELPPPSAKGLAIRGIHLGVGHRHRTPPPTNPPPRQAPPFMLALLQPPPPPLPRDLPADGPLATLEQRAHGRTLRLRVDWWALAPSPAPLSGEGGRHAAGRFLSLAAATQWTQPPGWSVPRDRLRLTNVRRMHFSRKISKVFSLRHVFVFTKTKKLFDVNLCSCV